MTSVTGSDISLPWQRAKIRLWVLKGECELNYQMHKEQKKIIFLHVSAFLRTFTRNFSNIDFFLKILPLKDHELAMSEM